MKAVVELVGKQYLVEPGTIFLVDKLPLEKGEIYSTDHVLMLLDGDDVVIGKPYIEKAKVVFSILDQTRRRKIIVQKFRSKKGFLKTKGHRQYATQVQVEIIEGAGKKDERIVEKKKKKPVKKSTKKKTDEKAAEKVTEKKPAEKKPAAKKTAAKKTTAKKTTTKKSVSDKPAAKKTTKKKATEEASD